MKKKFFSFIIIFICALFITNLIYAERILYFSKYNFNSFAGLSLTTDRVNGIVYLNQLRGYTGLNRLSENSLLDQSAQNHAEYLVINNVFSHYETSGYSGYTGTEPYERTQYVGYSGSKVSENISAGEDDIYSAVDDLFSAIYHRFGFLDLNINEVGVGEKYSENYGYKTVFVFNMGNNLSYSDKSLYDNNPEYVLWPYKDAENVTTVFYDEMPDPLPNCSVTGYPVSIEFNPEKIDTGSFSYLSFELLDNNNITINSTVLTKSSDPNGHLNDYQFALMPMERLKWDTNYTAKFKYMESGTTKEIVWSFHTKKIDYPYYKVSGNSATFNIKSNQTYIIYFVPSDCNDKFNQYSISYTGNAPDVKFVDFNTIQIKSSSTIGNYATIRTSNGKNVTLQVSNSDTATYPTSSNIETCSENNLENCNESECINIGKYWYDNKCNVTPQTTEENCDSSNLSLCNSQSECENADGYWYDNKCNMSPKGNNEVSNDMVYPTSTMNLVEYKDGAEQPNPSDNIVDIPASDGVYLQPTVSVDASDVGKNAYLVMYIYLTQLNSGFMLPVKTVTLESTQKFTNLSNALDFSDALGMTFDVYFGYRIGTVLKYSVFRVDIVEKSEENIVSDCSQYKDSDTCTGDKNCVVVTDFFGNFEKCVLNCTQYTDQTTCESAFDGKSCSWNVNFSTCGVK